MGVVVSAIATGLIHNIESDYIKVEEVDKDESRVIDIDETKNSRGDSRNRILTPGFPVVSIDIPPVHGNEGKLTKDNINKSQTEETVITTPVKAKDQINSLKQEKEVIEEDKMPMKQEKEEKDSSEQNLGFFKDFFSFLVSSSMPEDDNADSLKNETPPKNSVTFEESTTDFDKEEIAEEENEGRLPVINLLPTLTSELEFSQRRSDPAWFRRSYTSQAALQKIYLTHPKYTPRRRRPLSRSTSVIGTPLHRHRLCEDGCTTWGPQIRSGRKGTMSLASSPRRIKKTK